MLLQTLVEVHEVLLVGRQPSNLGQGEHTRIELIFGLGKGRATFRPEVGLHTEAVVLLRGAERAHGIVGIDAIHAVDGSIAVPTEVGLVGTHARGGYLKEVKVERHVGNGNAAETLGRGFARCAGPRHDNQGRLVGRLPMVLQFVPSNDLLAVVVLEPCAERFDQPRLEFVDTAQSFLLNASGTIGIVLPDGGGAFVATEVNLVEGEYLGHVTQYALEEVNHLVVADIQHIG